MLTRVKSKVAYFKEDLTGKEFEVAAHNLAVFERLARLNQEEFDRVSFRELRHLLHVSLNDVSQISEIPYRTLQDWDRGERTPKKAGLDQLRKAVTNYVLKGDKHE